MYELLFLLFLAVAVAWGAYAVHKAHVELAKSLEASEARESHHEAFLRTLKDQEGPQPIGPRVVGFRGSCELCANEYVYKASDLNEIPPRTVTCPVCGHMNVHDLDNVIKYEEHCDS